MLRHPSPLRISTPGRVCLFGEHQDYLQLPVIPCAISLRIAVEGRLRSDPQVAIALPDINGREEFSFEGPLPYTVERDYFKSAVHVLRRHGFTFSQGCDCYVHSTIPINAGTSSSSALVVAWVAFLAQMSDQRTRLTPDLCARYAYEAEVLEFGEPGGMMDQYSTSFGGVLYLEFYPELSVHPLHPRLGAFVLGDSGEPKDTKSILARVKNRVLDIARRITLREPHFHLRTLASADLGRFTAGLVQDERRLLEGTVRNRDITLEARVLLQTEPLDHRQVGALLSEHQGVLRDVLGISTSKIDRMIDASLRAGALGGKINGSGGGGCMFAYAPDHAEDVAAAIEREGGRAYIVRMDRGTVNEEAGVGVP